MQFHERSCQRLSFVLAMQIQKIRSNGMLCAYFRAEYCLIAIISNDTANRCARHFHEILLRPLKFMVL